MLARKNLLHGRDPVYGLYAVSDFSQTSSSDTPEVIGEFTVPANTFVNPGDTIQISGSLIFISGAPETAHYDVKFGGETYLSGDVLGTASLVFTLQLSLNDTSDQLLGTSSFIGFDEAFPLYSVVNPTSNTFDPTVSNDFELFANNSDDSSITLIFQEFAIFIPAPT